MIRTLLVSLLIVTTFLSCKKEAEVVPGNDIPYYGEVATIVLKNYVNRLYIDLIGREPLQAEYDVDIAFLRDNDLKLEARKEIIVRLQSDTNANPGDTTYKQAYFHRLYDLYKLHFIEGASLSEIGTEIGNAQNDYLRDSLRGDLAGMIDARARLNKLYGVISAEFEYRDSVISIDTLCSRMVNNAIYDIINMNSFNFVNAIFNDLFHRFPTQQEFDKCYEMVEFGRSSTIFGEAGSSKDELVNIIISSSEFYEGQLIWLYNGFLQRDPTTSEKLKYLSDLIANKNLQIIQEELLASREYASF